MTGTVWRYWNRDMYQLWDFAASAISDTFQRLATISFAIVRRLCDISSVVARCILIIVLLITVNLVVV